MNILHIVPSYKPAYIYGGPIESVARLCEAQVLSGHNVQVLTTTANGKTELEVVPGKETEVDKVNVIYFNRITKDHTHISPALWRYLLRHCQEYDIVHIHSWWSILVIVAAAICLQKGSKVVISPRGMLSPYILSSGNSSAKRWIHLLIGKKMLSKTVFHATAPSEYEECIAILPGWKGFILPNILLLPDISIRKKDNISFTLIFLSRLHPKKGLELLLEAITRLPFSFVLKIAGTGDEEFISKLKNKITELGITDKVEWIGWKNREEKFMELMNSDLFVLTSYNENFANVVIESLHVGTPVLVSEEVGLAGFVCKQKVGWTTSLDIESIRNTLVEACRDKERREFVHENGQRIIRNFFSEGVLTQKYIEQYQLVSGLPSSEII